MRPCLVLLALAWLSTSCANPPARPGEAADRTAIEAAYEDWYEAWRTKDHVLAAAHYAEDAEFVNAFGARRIGRAQIHELLERVFGMDFVMAGDSETVRKEIRFLGEDVALVTSEIRRVGQRAPDETPLGDRKTTHLRVFQRRGDRWVIVSHLISDARSTESAGH